MKVLPMYSECPFLCISNPVRNHHPPTPPIFNGTFQSKGFARGPQISCLCPTTLALNWTLDSVLATEAINLAGHKGRQKRADPVGSSGLMSLPELMKEMVSLRWYLWIPRSKVCRLKLAGDGVWASRADQGGALSEDLSNPRFSHVLGVY